MKTNAKEKMWAIMVPLGVNMDWDNPQKKLIFDEDIWNYIIDEAPKAGFNTILLDVNDGVQFKSHPEVSTEGAWSPEKIKEELKKCRERGLKVIPKLNFSATHDVWLKKYAWMLSTDVYYQVCKDLINELYELFEEPEYIHLGMDEENNFMMTHAKVDLVVYRRGELLWHDLRFLVDCVKETGATPWIWHDMLFKNPEEFKKRFSTDELLISPWYYRAFHEEHFAPMPPERYEELGEFKYLEEGHFFANFRRVACPLAKDGFKYVPTGSAWGGNPHNSYELMEHFEEGAPDESIVGYLSAPWGWTTPEFKERYEESFKVVKEARAHFYED